MELGPGQAEGAPDHPHRGFETVTYLLDGEFVHADSQGNTGRLGPGDVQWMTAGDGVVHSEMPAEKIRREGGRVHGFQIWVNLPRARQADAAALPGRQGGVDPRRRQRGRQDASAGHRRRGARQARGHRHAHADHLPALLAAAGRASRAGAAGEHNVFVYVLGGAVDVGGRTVRDGQLAILGAGDAVELAANEPAELLLLGGKPLGEPVARYGPFVMNTREELSRRSPTSAAGRMGAIPPKSPANSANFRPVLVFHEVRWSRTSRCSSACAAGRWMPSTRCICAGSGGCTASSAPTSTTPPRPRTCFTRPS